MRQQTPTPTPKSPWLLNLLGLLVPALLLGFCRPLAIYFIAIAPALPIIVLVLFIQLRNHWSQPAVAVGLCTLTGLSCGYVILFIRFYYLVAAHWQHSLMALVPASS